jgi:glutathione S-transferase
MADLVLYAENEWVSPWAFHAMVALEEKRLPYDLEVVSLPIPANKRQTIVDKAILGKVPVLVHGDLWLTESLAISEYLAERFPTPAHPRIFPADLGERARSRQLMSFLRTSSFALREDRPTVSVFGPPTTKPMSDKGKVEAAELLRIAERLIAPGKHQMFTEWCIADADLARMLMRLVHNNDPVPTHLVDYTLAQWQRPSIREFLSHVPTRPD